MTDIDNALLAAPARLLDRRRASPFLSDPARKATTFATAVDIAELREGLR
jgi:hypothetical protein